MESNGWKVGVFLQTSDLNIDEHSSADGARFLRAYLILEFPLGCLSKKAKVGALK